MIRFHASALRLLVYAALVLAGLDAQPLRSQPFRLLTPTPASPSPEARRSFQLKIDEQARALADEPGLNGIPLEKRQALIEFVFGNVLFVTTHEMGFALFSEMQLPTVAGEEQAADDFAVLAILQHGEAGLSDRILIEAAKGWSMSAKRK